MIHILECLKYAEVNWICQNIILTVITYLQPAFTRHRKIFEYTVDLETGLIDYDENFRKEWITHSQYGFSLCMMNGFKD